MYIRLFAITLAISVAGTLPAVGVPAAVAQPPAPDPSAEAEKDLRNQSPGRVTVRRDERGVVHFVGTQTGKPTRRPGEVPANASAERKAAAHLKRYGALWALHHRKSEVRPSRSFAGPGRQSTVHFQQTLDGVPVFGGELVVTVDSAGNLMSVTGETTPEQLPSEELTISPERAQETALAVTARAHRVDPSALDAGTAEAVVYDPVLVTPFAEPGLSQVWQVEVTGPAEVRHLVLVNRADGRVVLDFNLIGHADQVVCDRANIRDTSSPPPECVQPGARSDGMSETGQQDVDDAYRYTDHTASFFERIGVPNLTELIGSDNSAEPGDKRARSTVRYCPSTSSQPVCDSSSPYRNAFWNGRGAFYGEGFAAADDVVAHELTHGVVQMTARLRYWYQSGAINESMADVFGELLDLTNPDTEAEHRWKIGEGSPLGIIRNMADPPSRGDPDKMTSERYVSFTVDHKYFDYGGVHSNSGVGNKAAYLIARPPTEGAVTFNGQTITGIGYLKAAKIYYRALTMLTSGSDYADLYNVLPQACANLAAAGESGIAMSDCRSVSQAVTATEMNKQPASPDAQAPDAPIGCSADNKRDMFLDGFEDSVSANWSRTPSNLWPQLIGYAKSGTRSFYGIEPNRRAGDPSDTYARLTTSFPIPSGVRTFVRFDHQHLLAHVPGEYYAGARLEYSTDGTNWSSAMDLPWAANGSVPRTITPYRSDGTRAPAYQGFGGDSHGYTSSRVNLTSLAGETVHLRWRITADPDYSRDGWTLDNVNVYSCATRPSAPRPVTATGALRKAVVEWTPPQWTGTGGVTKYRITVSPGGKVIDGISPTATRIDVRDLSIGVTYTFKVWAYSDAGGGGPAAKRLIGTKVSATASPRTIRPGKSSTISGRVYRVDTGSGRSGWAVQLQGRGKETTKWHPVARKLTSRGGAYSFTVRPTRSTQYRVRYFSRNPVHMGTRSAISTVTVS